MSTGKAEEVRFIAKPAPIRNTGHARIPELDGLRGLAIIFVLVFHFRAYVGDKGVGLWAVDAAASMGWCGVDLFFALSGFLITGILLDSAETPNRGRNFYMRRALRILPLYYLAVAGVFSFAAIKGTPVPLSSQTWYWLHLSNWPTAFEPMLIPRLTHFWSLAIEEQFYIVWPVVVWGLSRRALSWVSCAIVAVCLVLRNLGEFQAAGVAHENFLYRLTPFRIDTLLMGALAAIIYRDSGMRAMAERYAGNWVFIGAALSAATLASAGSGSPHSQAMTRVGYSSLGLLFACSVLYASLHSGSHALPSRLLRLPLLRSFGRYSYCMYVIHVAVYSFALSRIRATLGDGAIATVGAGLACVTLIYLLAVCSWHALERHFIAAQSRFQSR